MIAYVVKKKQQSFENKLSRQTFLLQQQTAIAFFSPSGGYNYFHVIVDNSVFSLLLSIFSTTMAKLLRKQYMRIGLMSLVHLHFGSHPSPGTLKTYMCHLDTSFGENHAPRNLCSVRTNRLGALWQWKSSYSYQNPLRSNRLLIGLLKPKVLLFPKHSRFNQYFTVIIWHCFSF